MPRSANNSAQRRRVAATESVTSSPRASKVAMEAKIVPSGVAEVARLQAREGFVYLRP